jgi:hypothetical protein
MEKYPIEFNEDTFQKTVEILSHLNPRLYPKAIKVTNEFLQYIEAKYKTEVVLVNSAQGLTHEFVGVPVFVDNTIKHPYYEFVY